MTWQLETRGVYLEGNAAHAPVWAMHTQLTHMHTLGTQKASFSKSNPTLTLTRNPNHAHALGESTCSSVGLTFVTQNQ